MELENPQKSHGNLEIEMVMERYETLPYDFMAKAVAVLLVLQSPSTVDAVRAAVTALTDHILSPWRRGHQILQNFLL